MGQIQDGRRNVTPEERAELLYTSPAFIDAALNMDMFKMQELTAKTIQQAIALEREACAAYLERVVADHTAKHGDILVTKDGVLSLAFGLRRGTHIKSPPPASA